MKIYSEDLGASIYSIPEKCAWRLWTELNNRDEAVILLDIEGLDYKLCDSWEYIQGQARLGSLDVLEFYSAVVKRVHNLLLDGSVDFVDLEEVKDAVMPTFWEAWKNRGIVDGECWKYVEVQIQ